MVPVLFERRLETRGAKHTHVQVSTIPARVGLDHSPSRPLLPGLAAEVSIDRRQVMPLLKVGIRVAVCGVGCRGAGHPAA